MDDELNMCQPERPGGEAEPVEDQVPDNESFGAAEKPSPAPNDSQAPSLVTGCRQQQSEGETPLTKHIYSLIEQQEYGQAIHVLQTLLDSGRRERSVLSVLGYCHFTVQNFEAAAEVYQALSDSVSPDVPEYAFYLVQSLYLSNQRQRAFQVCRDRLFGTGSPFEAQARQLCSTILYEDGLYDEALSLMQESPGGPVEQPVPRSYQSALNEGCIHFQRRDFPQALALF